MSKLFGKKQTPEELCKKWRLELRKQERELDRSIREITNAENKMKMEIRKYAKVGDTTNAKTLARELVTSRKAKERLYTQKAQLNSVALQLQQQSGKTYSLKTNKQTNKHFPQNIRGVHFVYVYLFVCLFTFVLFFENHFFLLTSKLQKLSSNEFCLLFYLFVSIYMWRSNDQSDWVHAKVC